MGGQPIDARFPFRRNESSSRARSQAARCARGIKEGVPEVVIVEDSVDVRSEDAPVRADGAVRYNGARPGACYLRKGHGFFRVDSLADVDLVTAESTFLRMLSEDH